MSKGPSAIHPIEGNREQAPLSWLTVHPKGSLVALHNRLGNGEAQPGAACFAGTITIYPIKTFKNMGLLLGRNANPGILHRKGGCVVVGSKPHHY